MEFHDDRKIVELMTQMRDIMKWHDRGVRPTVIIVMVLLVLLILVTYFR